MSISNRRPPVAPLTAVLAVVAAAALLISILVSLFKSSKEVPQLKEITAYYPFGFSDSLDPRHINTVGDQVLAEHVFAFHGSQGRKVGFSPVFSLIEFDERKSEILLSLIEKVIRSDGLEVSLEQICKGIEESFRGTQHAEYKKLYVSINCQGNSIRVKLKKIPSNMKALFSLPDFSIYQPETLPITKQAIAPTTGPYRIESFDSSQVRLERNPHYPKHLVANDIDHATLNFYPPAEADKFIAQANPKQQNLVYIIGASLTEPQIQKLKDQGYTLEMNPSEWMGHLGFNESIALEDRLLVGEVVDSIRPKIEAASPLGQPAYSIPPSDRPYGLGAREYLEITTRLKNTRKHKKPSKKLVFGTMDFIYKLPFVKETLNRIKEELGEFAEIKVLESKNYSRLFSSDVDVYLSIQGISAADPAHHLTFFLKNDKVFSEAISLSDVLSLATNDNAEAFASSAKALEVKLLEKRAVIPLIHFPGVVASATFLERDDALAGSWGIRTWTYRIR